VRTRFVLPVLLVAGALFVGACSSDDDKSEPEPTDTTSQESAPETSAPASTATLSIPEGAAFNATDVYFAQGMIPHHAQAIEMAEMAAEISTNPDVIALAEEIQAAQGPEIDEMTAWLIEWEQDVPDPDAAMDENMQGAGGMMMGGMMSEADMARLGNATGTEFDQMFLEMMILHHEGAIEMAEQEVAEGMYQPLVDLAQSVVDAQQGEIDEMNALISELAG
jgi:uncharacterized protein (DUF305 family)